MGAPRYSSGKHAHGVCDRCGVSFKLHTLRGVVVNGARQGIKVCRGCWEEDHPQYKVGRVPVVDPQSIRDPRPDTGEAASRDIQWGWAPVGLANTHGLSGLKDMLEAIGEVGTVTVST